MQDMDQLSAVLERFSVDANVFFTGNLCRLESFADTDNAHGHLHVLKSGHVTFVDAKGGKQVLTEPSVVFVPQGGQHKLIPDTEHPPELVCANINFQDSQENPLVAALPKILIFPMQSSVLLSDASQWLFDEAFNKRSGRRVMIDRLCDVFMIEVLRYVTEHGLIRHGMVAGLSHPQLAKVMMMIHEQPERNWTLEELAEEALMSRSKFAEVFRDVVGQPPGDYILDWRVAVAQGLLKQNKPVNLVANEVGYENGSALARVFRKKTGLSPREWLKKLQLGGDA